MAKILVDQDASVTATGARVGTVVYMAPEQIEPRRPTGVGSDRDAMSEKKPEDRFASAGELSDALVALISSHQMVYRWPGILVGPLRSEDTTEKAGWGIEIREGHSIRAIAADGERYQATDLQPVSSDRWIFWCMVFDRQLGQMKLWSDGEMHGQVPIPPGSIDSFNNGHAINIGRDGSSEGERFLQGRVCNLAIWRRAIQDNEAIALQEAGMETTRELLASEVSK